MEGGGDAVNINIRRFNGTKFSVQVSLESSVQFLKSVVAENCDIPAEQQRLIYKSQILNDDQTLSNFGLEADHTVHLVPRFLPDASNNTTNTFEEGTMSGSGGSSSSTTDFSRFLEFEEVPRRWFQNPRYRQIAIGLELNRFAVECVIFRHIAVSGGDGVEHEFDLPDLEEMSPPMPDPAISLMHQSLLSVRQNLNQLASQQIMEFLSIYSQLVQQQSYSSGAGQTGGGTENIGEDMVMNMLSGRGTNNFNFFSTDNFNNVGPEEGYAGQIAQLETTFDALLATSRNIMEAINRLIGNHPR